MTFPLSEALVAASFRQNQGALALASLSKRFGHSASVDLLAPSGEVFESDESVAEWLNAAATSLKVEIESVSTKYADAEGLLRSCGPAILRVRDGQTERYLAVVRATRRGVRVATPSGRTAVLDFDEVLNAAMQPITEWAFPLLDGWLEAASVPPSERPRLRDRLLRQQLGGQVATVGWIVRLPPSAPVFAQLRHDGALAGAGLYGLCMLLELLFGYGAWLVLGRGATFGGMTMSALAGWFLLTLTTLPLHYAMHVVSADLSVRTSAVLKRRLLAGAIAMDPSKVRELGAGRVLAIVSESQNLDSSGIGALLSLGSAAVTLIAAALVLSRGIGGMTHVIALVAWIVVVSIATVASARRTSKLTEHRVTMTQSLVERLLGHRTRLVQQSERLRHTAEDEELDQYIEGNKATDSLAALLEALPSRGWLTLGFLSLVPLLLGEPADASRLLVTIGGLLAAQVGFSSLIASWSSAARFWMAWSVVRPLFRAGAAAPHAGLPALSVAPKAVAPHEEEVIKVLRASYSYSARSGPVLRDVSLTIRNGDRLLLEGPSGGGKSTFVNMLAGIRSPDAGVLLLRGFDLRSLGSAGWRKQVASAPQFQENHVFTGTLAFNLLLGRNWPATIEDLQAANEVCVDLGLEALLKKMPSGLDQQLGETGWQLSHGERSRIFLARALLQNPSLLLLDETFGALDPLTMRQCMEVVLARSNAVLVIAHP
ncbi:MAG: ABC transporter ATP-binding protein [Polyangiaceae bacterium]